MAEKIMYFTDKPLSAEEKAAQIRMIIEKYNWERITEETLKVYRKEKNSEKVFLYDYTD